MIYIFVTANEVNESNIIRRLVNDVFTLPAMKMRARCALSWVLFCDVITTALVAIPVVGYGVY